MCFLAHGTNTTECGCPQGLVLSKDEKNCIDPIKCEPKQFRCSNGISCIDAIFRCNGSPDCLDGSDEHNCPKCGLSQFTCFKEVINQELICLDKSRICDGHKDCYDGHDELCCLDKFLCNSRHCLTSDQLCDGKKDCIDGEDENLNTCHHYPSSKASVEAYKSYSLYVVVILGIIFFIVFVFQCKRCVNGQTEKHVTDILMTEQRPTFTNGILNNRNPHRKLNYNKKPLLSDKHKLDNCNTLTSTTTVSAFDTLPNENNHLALEGIVGPTFSHPLQTKLLMEQPNMSSSSSSGAVTYPRETVNPPPSPVTERSQSTYSTHSSSFFVPRPRTRNKNLLLSQGKSSASNRRHKKPRWPKSSQRGPPPTPCETEIYMGDDDMEESTMKYIFYDNNTQTEIDDFGYKPPPPTPRHYFSDPSCPPSPVTEHSFCNLNLNPPPPSPVQESD